MFACLFLAWFFQPVCLFALFFFVLFVSLRVRLLVYIVSLFLHYFLCWFCSGFEKHNYHEINFNASHCLPPLVFRCRERTFRRHDDAWIYTAHAGHHRTFVVCRCHGEYPTRTNPSQLLLYLPPIGKYKISWAAWSLDTLAQDRHYSKPNILHVCFLFSVASNYYEKNVNEIIIRFYAHSLGTYPVNDEDFFHRHS